MVRFLKYLGAVLALTCAAYSSAQAQGKAPDDIVREGVTEVLSEIKKNPDPRALQEFAEKKLLSQFDFTAMTRLATGRAWRQATDAQKKALENAFRTLLVLVSIVIIALIVYVLTIEKIKSIATLKLIGAPNSVIVRLIMEQSLALTLASFAVAYVLREAIAPGFPRTLHLLASETAATFAVMLGGGVVASLMAIWHALRTPPQLALGG